MTVAGAGWLAHRSNQVSVELSAVSHLAPRFKEQLLLRDGAGAATTLQDLKDHTRIARSAVSDPLWKAAKAMPYLGDNFSAVTELVLSTDDVLNRAAGPLLSTSQSFDWTDLTPAHGRFDTKSLAAASPSIVSAANTIDLTHARLADIDKTYLIPSVSAPLATAIQSLDELRQVTNAAAMTSKLLPSMLGEDGVRNYLVLVQNSAEVRATGGLPGALAVLRVDKGAVKLVAQTSGAAIKPFNPPVQVDPQQSLIYTPRLGTYIGDVNLTPDFPTAAGAAKAMWTARNGTAIDGVIALDPVVLSHILEVSGPMSVPGGNDSVIGRQMPSVLTSKNVVKTLLSDAYTLIEDNREQDAYFATVTERIFRKITEGGIPGERLVTALARSVEENRLYVWSAHPEEQGIIESMPLGGAVSGASVGGTSFGVYFNDGTGAKMDYYIRRTVELAKMCTSNGYSEYKVRIKMTNVAPRDAAVSLPIAVTGGGLQGTPPGRVETNVIAYGPAQARVEGATVNGVEAAVGSFLHSQRPVGIVRTNLGPGQSSLVELYFSRVVQNQEPKLRMTPTVEDPAKIVKVTGSHTPCNKP